MEKERGAPFLACALFMVLLTTGTVGVHGRTHRHRRRGQPLFVFGDSYADTGNLAKIIGPCWNEPYGVTFPRKPAGRFSDGRVFTDYLASLFGIRSPLPYKYRKYGKKLLPYGMNFAVGGSGVFDGLFFQDNLTVQIDHFQAQVDEGVFSDLDLARSTAVVCIAGNDYMFYEEAGGTLEVNWIDRVLALSIKKLETP
ncbi:hypothetical protein Taro_008488 [Colocasia esculenta]|uniref:GDSL esterase/lipase n=1 Tax=Colocasia esculenta TaxID=4460 RepID=A0A843U167_COLES|nr:hypothetical protein [Colocasia esculenta]